MLGINSYSKVAVVIIFSELVAQGIIHILNYVKNRSKNLSNIACTDTTNTINMTHNHTPINNNTNSKYFCTVVFFPDKKLLSDMTRENNDELYTENERYSESNPVPTSVPVQSSLEKVVRCLDSARHSIDVCVLLFTCLQLAKPLLKAKERGVRVRVLLDHNNERVEGSKFQWLRRHNIIVRLHSATAMMHHKFALVDACSDPNDSQDMNITRQTSILSSNNLVGEGVSWQNVTDSQDMDTTRQTSILSNNNLFGEDVSCQNVESARPAGRALLLNGSFNWTWSAVVNNCENLVITNRPDLINPFVEQFNKLWQQGK